MKFSLILLAYMLLFNPSALGQNYPLVTDSATWSYYDYYYDEFGNIIENSKLNYLIEGDTLIEGMAYKKMYTDYWNQQQPPLTTCFKADNIQYYGAVREDGDQVWLRLRDSVEYVHYDFGLNVGDTFCYSYSQPADPNPCYEVVLVDSIFLDGSYRKQIHFSAGGNEETWIEGVGSATNWYAMWHLIGNIGTQIRCARKQNLIIYGNPAACTCDVGSSIKTPSLIREFSIQPNPFHDFTSISFSLDRSEKIEWQVSNALGQTLYIGVKEFSAGKQQIEINQPLTSGIYFVSLTVRGMNFSQKLLCY